MFLHISFFSEYLNKTMPRKHRIALAKFQRKISKQSLIFNILLSRGRNRLLCIACLCRPLASLTKNSIAFFNVRYLKDLNILYSYFCCTYNNGDIMIYYYSIVYSQTVMSIANKLLLFISYISKVIFLM